MPRRGMRSDCRPALSGRRNSRVPTWTKSGSPPGRASIAPAPPPTLVRRCKAVPVRHNRLILTEHRQRKTARSSSVPAARTRRAFPSPCCNCMHGASPSVCPYLLVCSLQFLKVCFQQAVWCVPFSLHGVLLELCTCRFIMDSDM